MPILQTEMVKAIAVDSHWHNWGGLAIDTTMSEVQEYTSDDVSGVQLVLSILFRVSELDPYTARA